MAEGGCRREPVEVTALRTNLNAIADAVTVGDTLQWFSNCLVQYSFISGRAARGILRDNSTPRAKVNELLESVLNIIRATDEKRRYRFEQFVSIFSNEPVYDGLVTKLQLEVTRSQQVASHLSLLSLRLSPESAATPDLLSPASPAPSSTALDSGVESSDASPLDSHRIRDRYNLRSTMHTSFLSLDRVKATIDKLEETFGTISASTEIELSKKEAEDNCFLIVFRHRLLLLPVRKNILHVKFFNDSENDILEARSSKKILAILARYMDYQNHEILKMIVNKVCSASLKEQMAKFCISLEEFETATTVDVYLSAIPDEVNEELRTGFTEMVLKIDKPESQCTLLEVRNLNRKIIRKSTLCSHSVYIGAVSSGSVVVRLRFPSSAVGWVLAAITPDLMTSHRITEVTLDERQLNRVQVPRYELVCVYTLKTRESGVPNPPPPPPPPPPHTHTHHTHTHTHTCRVSQAFA